MQFIMSFSTLRSASCTVLNSRLKSNFVLSISSFSKSPCATPTQCKRRASTLAVNAQRLSDSIHHTCQWGVGERWGDRSTETGMSRLSLSDADKTVRQWFADKTESLGCSVTVDEMGNMFAVRPGKYPGTPTFAGSHLDTQPTGGRYDGILGVHAAVEMLQVLHDSKFETEYPIGVANWTNEEGARFPKSMVSSGVWAGKIPLADAHNLNSVTRGETATMLTELDRIGFHGKVPCSYESTKMAAHFELHIEQGPILEREQRKIGIVEGVQAYRWYTITVKGRDCHTGTTDFSSRADALLAASKMIVASHEVALEEGGLASTGIIEARPGSTNTVPGNVTFSLDLRSKSGDVVDTMEQRLHETFADIASGKASSHGEESKPLNVVQVSWKRDFESAATRFNKDCIKCVYASAEEVFGDKTEALTKRMVSGAGHDSVYTSTRVPTSMIFVPSRNGISHNPEEYTSPEDCALGAQVLMGAVLNYDRLRTS